MCSRAAISASSTVRVRSISRWRTSRSDAMRASLIARSLEMRDFSISSRAAICACSASVSRTARSRASSARCTARRTSTSRCWFNRAVSLSRSMSSACRSASRLRVRIRIIDSCSMSLRSLRRDSISWISCVRPCASKRLDGLKYSRSVWSRSVIATDSSSRPFCARPSAAACFTRVTYSPRCSCISSIDISDAIERSAETNLPESSACRRSCSMVRRPSVAAAIDTASVVGFTRT